MATSRRIALGIAVLLLIPICVSPQVQPTNPEPMAIITIVGEINAMSVGQLLAVVSGQVRSGMKKIRIVIASGGGDPSAGFSAYNYLRGLQDVEISTFNVGNVDSAAVLLFCAGQNRYSVPGARFVIHGNSLTIAGNATMDAASLQGNLEILKNLNQMVVQVLDSTTGKERKTDIENAVKGQIVLTAEEAVKWGLVKEIRANFMEPGATFSYRHNSSSARRDQTSPSIHINYTNTYFV